MQKDTQKKIGVRWRLRKKVVDSNTNHSQVQSPPEQLILLSKASDVPMYKFIDCMCNNNLTQLVVSGEPSPEQLAEAWTELFFEYCDLIEATETKYRVRLVSEISLNEQKIELVSNWVKILEISYMPKLVSALHILDINYELDPRDSEQYQKDLKRIHAELNLSRLELRIKKAEYAAIISNQSTTQSSVDEKYFKTMFFRINNYAKREAVNGMTTVQDYCVALKDYVEFALVKK